MTLEQLWKSGLAVVFASTLTLSNVGCEPPADPAPETPSTEVDDHDHDHADGEMHDEDSSTTGEGAPAPTP